MWKVFQFKSVIMKHVKYCYVFLLRTVRNEIAELYNHQFNFTESFHISNAERMEKKILKCMMISGKKLKLINKTGKIL